MGYNFIHANTDPGKILYRYGHNLSYTGHCPTLKFHFGKRYGASTKEILKEMGEKGVWARHINSSYRACDPLKGLLNGGELRPIERTKGQMNIGSSGIGQGRPFVRSRPYILGYTGFIPGLNFNYGKSYGQAADESMHNFEMKKAAPLVESRMAFDSSQYRNKERKNVKLQPTYPEDKLRRALLDLDEKYRYKDEHISPEKPPIAGYTGHIPRLRSTETSLSQRYHTAAQRGLYLLQQDRQKHNYPTGFNPSELPAVPNGTLPITTPVF